jgi:3-methyladenine DNA glycosylase AlkD
MTTKEILKELQEYGDEQTKSTLMKHGAKEPIFGVKVQDLKKILKKTKKNHELSLELFATGNSDAMYLAGLMADEKQITKEQLEDWVDKAYWSYLCEYTVPWVAAESEYGFELGLKWIKSDKETVASAGWGTLAYYAAVNKDEKLDPKVYINLLDTVKKKYTVPKIGFVIP